MYIICQNRTLNSLQVHTLYKRTSGKHKNSRGGTWRCRLKCSPLMQKVGWSNLSCDRSLSLKQLKTTPVWNVWQQVCVSRVIGDDALCHNSCGKLKNPNCSMAINAEYRLKFANFSILKWEEKPPCPQTSKQTNKTKRQSHDTNKKVYRSTKFLWTIHLRCKINVHAET